MIRKYNIDAYRNATDLGVMVRAELPYNNLLLTCYDASLLLLLDVYYAPGSNYPQLHRMTLPDVVKAISEKDKRVTTLFGDYVSMYRTYSAVYHGKLAAKKVNVDTGLKVLNNIVDWYINNIDYANLIELYEFVLPGKELGESYQKASEANRKYLAHVAGLDNIPKSL